MSVTEFGKGSPTFDNNLTNSLSIKIPLFYITYDINC